MMPTQFDLAKTFWNFSFNNPEKIRPAHAAIYFFAVEHCNRLGWKEKFGLPTSMVMEATGVKSYTTYKILFDDLVEWELFEVIEYSKNQHTSNIIALSKNDKAPGKAPDKAPDKALDKATVNHIVKHPESTCESTCESTVSIDKQVTKELLTIEPSSTSKEENDDAGNEVNVYENLEVFKKKALASSLFCITICQKGIDPPLLHKWFDAFHRRLIFIGDTLKSEVDYRKHFASWLVKIPGYRKMHPDDYSPAKDAEIQAQFALTDTDRAILAKCRR